MILTLRLHTYDSFKRCPGLSANFSKKKKKKVNYSDSLGYFIYEGQKKFTTSAQAVGRPLLRT